MARFVFVTGGVMSSIGKGISSASIGVLLMHIINHPCYIAIK